MAQVFAKNCSAGSSSQTPHIYDQAVRNSLRDRPIGYVVNSHHMHGYYRFKEDVESYEPLIDGLELAFSNAVFCCGGDLHIPDAEIETSVLKVKPAKDAGSEDEWKEFPLDKILPEEILKYCNPSPFGDLKEMKTVLDPEVRLAHQIETERFDFGSPARVFPGESAITQHIEEELVPGRRILLQRNKLNIYGKGGFFKSHVDSPSHDNMIGTLVVCLPSRHEGGQLVIRHDGLEHGFDFSKHSNDPSKLQWAAFYGDCEHEVHPVTEGFRVTITYSINYRFAGHNSLKTIYYKPKPDIEKRVEEHFEISAKSPLRSFVKVDCALQNLPDRLGKTAPEYIGLILKHKYTLPGLQPDMLKGEDQTLLEYLTAQGWNCKLQNILSRFMTKEIYADDLEERECKETHEIYEFKPLVTSETNFLYNTLEWSNHSSYRSVHQWRVGIPFIEIYRQPDDSKLVRNKPGYKSWVGNEVHDLDVDKIYLDSALIVKLRSKK